MDPRALRLREEESTHFHHRGVGVQLQDVR
jgi:hypothetical protein